jgi:hypothetical protein
MRATASYGPTRQIFDGVDIQFRPNRSQADATGLRIEIRSFFACARA